jgi:UDP-2,4-diacetamido-2,4,6-trideoxy-beta-L-altropyranose hydrolase
VKTVFRADSSVHIGSGHVMRCLTLADQLVVGGASISFLCRELPGAMSDVIRQRGHSCLVLNLDKTDVETDVKAALDAIGGADWLIVDHYGLDAKWETLMRPATRKIMVIDDLANRPHDCDLLLDQNFYDGFESRYDGLVSDSTRCLLGPTYVVLRPEFSSARKTLRQRDGTIGRILVFFGGSDPTNQTLRALEGIDALQRPDIVVDAIVGSGNPHRNEVRAFCDSKPWANFHCQISNMAELIAAADLGIGAGGAAMWERCALGLPTLTVTFADNQVLTTQDVAKTGAIAYLGWSDDLSSADYADAIRAFLDRPDDLLSISSKALELIDASNNGVESVIRAMNEITNIKTIP